MQGGQRHQVHGVDPHATLFVRLPYRCPVDGLVAVDVPGQEGPAAVHVARPLPQLQQDPVVAAEHDVGRRDQQRALGHMVVEGVALGHATDRDTLGLRPLSRCR